MKATHEQLRRHNLQLLLRAIYGGQADSRTALAQRSGLTKPTVSNLVAELLEQGLVSENGRGPSTGSGGQRPRLLRFEPDARQVIGVAVEAGRARAVLSNLAGRITARHIVELPAEVLDANRAPRPHEVLAAIHDAIGGLRAQRDAPLLCIGVGVPATLAEGGAVAGGQAAGGAVAGSPARAAGAVRAGGAATAGRAAAASLPSELHARYGVPGYVANTAELCALGQLAYGGLEATPGTLVTLMIDQGVEIGVSLDGGGVHYGGDIGSLRAPLGHGATLVDTLRWGHTKRRIAALRREAPTTLPPERLSYLHLRAAARHGDPVAVRVLDELAAALAPVVAWCAALLRPEQITLAGPIVDLGEEVLARVAEHADALLPRGWRARTRLARAYASDLGSMGAVALALQGELGLL